MHILSNSFGVMVHKSTFFGIYLDKFSSLIARPKSRYTDNISIIIGVPGDGGGLRAATPPVKLEIVISIKAIFT